MTTPSAPGAFDLTGLPAGLTARPLRPEDSAAVTAVIAAEELADMGEVLIEEADIVADWQRPSYDLGSRSVGVLDGEALVAFAEVSGHDRGYAGVMPEHRGRGIGTWLAARVQDLARAQGSTAFGMPVVAGSPGDELLESLGFRVRWTSWALELPEGRTIPERPLPEGYEIREATEDDHEAVWQVTEDAFLEWSVRERQGFADWRASVPGRPGFEPWNLRVVTDPSGEVVAICFVVLAADAERGSAWIERLATRRDQRGRGLAQALLADAFAQARSHGAVRSTLVTDSRTGALPLYEKVGMRVYRTWFSRAIDL